jgi:hypothetical protein
MAETGAPTVLQGPTLSAPVPPVTIRLATVGCRIGPGRKTVGAGSAARKFTRGDRRNIRRSGNLTKLEFRQQISELLNATLESGPGPRAVGLITADVLAAFIMNEAGGDTPAAVDEVAERMQDVVDGVLDYERVNALPEVLAK